MIVIVFVIYLDVGNLLEGFVEVYVQVKKVEDVVKKYCVEIEECIFVLVLVCEEGSEIMMLGNGFKLMIIGKFLYKVDDIEVLCEIMCGLDGYFVLIKFVSVFDEIGCKYLCCEWLDLWKQVVGVIMVVLVKIVLKVGV